MPNPVSSSVVFERSAVEDALAWNEGEKGGSRPGVCPHNRALAEGLIGRLDLWLMQRFVPFQPSGSVSARANEANHAGVGRTRAARHSGAKRHPAPLPTMGFERAT
jgi:hypothetical protein